MMTMMKRKTLVSSLAIAFFLLGSAQAGERRYRDEISGTGAPSSFDFNGDGVNALYITFSGLSSLGPVHGGFVVDYDFPNLGPDPSCTGGTLKLPILASSSNRALTLGGQLFLQDDIANSLFCLNPATGAFKMSLKGAFTGGLGRFKGATGTYEYEGEGNVLLVDTNGMPFGGFVVKTKGKLMLPN